MASAARIDWEAAFAYYAELGWQRRYAAVAERYSVSLTAVKEHARRNGWQGRVTHIDARARARADRRLERVLVAAIVRDVEAIIAA